MRTLEVNLFFQVVNFTGLLVETASVHSEGQELRAFADLSHTIRAYEWPRTYRISLGSGKWRFYLARVTGWIPYARATWVVFLRPPGPPTPP